MKGIKTSFLFLPSYLIYSFLLFPFSFLGTNLNQKKSGEKIALTLMLTFAYFNFFESWQGRSRSCRSRNSMTIFPRSRNRINLMWLRNTDYEDHWNIKRIKYTFKKIVSIFLDFRDKECVKLQNVIIWKKDVINNS
jgi:hypothetical protein